MSPNPPKGFRWRTVLEVAVISAVIYVFLGAPGFPALATSTLSNEDSDVPVPIAQIKLDTLVSPDRNLDCPEHKYAVHVFSTAPLVVYIDGFLSDSEAEYLISQR